MNSHNINYNDNTEIVLYLAQILNEFDDFNKTVCGKHYVASNINYIINELITKIQNPKVFEIIFKTFEILKKYVMCIDVAKFVAISNKWNIRRINFNISDFLHSQLSSKINDPELINRIVNEYLKTLIVNIEYILKNFRSVLKNISNNYLPPNSPEPVIEDSKYKLSFKKTDDLTEENKRELETKLKSMIHDTFYILRKLLSSSTYHLKLINEKYESLLSAFITDHLPYQYYTNIIDTFECLDLYIKCIDLNKLVSETEKMNMQSVSFDIRARLLQMFGVNANDASKAAFIKSLMTKTENIFKCIDYILANPRTVLNNSKVFIEAADDDLFS